MAIFVSQQSILNEVVVRVHVLLHGDEFGISCSSASLALNSVLKQGTLSKSFFVPEGRFFGRGGCRYLKHLHNIIVVDLLFHLRQVYQLQHPLRRLSIDSGDLEVSGRHHELANPLIRVTVVCFDGEIALAPSSSEFFDTCCDRKRYLFVQGFWGL